LYVQGRSNEIIKVKRYQVAATELEEVIHNYKIQDVAVVGVAQDNYGKISKTFVVPKSGVKINNENELKEFVTKRVAKYKRLGYIQVIKSIPKTVSGNIL